MGLSENRPPREELYRKLLDEFGGVQSRASKSRAAEWLGLHRSAMNRWADDMPDYGEKLLRLAFGYDAPLRARPDGALSHSAGTVAARSIAPAFEGEDVSTIDMETYKLAQRLKQLQRLEAAIYDGIKATVDRIVPPDDPPAAVPVRRPKRR